MSMTQMKNRRKVMIVSESDSFFTNIQSILPKTDFFPIFQAHSGSEARRKLLELPVDILIVDSPLPDEHGAMFAQGYSDTNMGILLLVTPDMYNSTVSQVEESGIVTLPKPNSPELFYTSLKVLSAMTYRLEKLENERKALQEKMQDLRVINKAKWVLIDKKKMTEADAHHFIEKRAMDERKSRRQIAEEIIDSEDF